MTSGNRRDQRIEPEPPSGVSRQPRLRCRSRPPGLNPARLPARAGHRGSGNSFGVRSPRYSSSSASGFGSRQLAARYTGFATLEGRS